MLPKAGNTFNCVNLVLPQSMEDNAQILKHEENIYRQPHESSILAPLKR